MTVLTLLQLIARDAQRSARDTEIIVTLVNSATEMRNSFEDLKKRLIESEDFIIGNVQDNTEKTIKRHLGGPVAFDA